MVEHCWAELGERIGLFFAAGPAPGAIAWYDPSVASSITSSGGAVSQLNDLSGNAHHIVQATVGKKPTTASRTINSLNALDYVAASNQCLIVTFNTSLPITILGVIKSDLTGVANGQWMGNIPDGVNTSPTIYQETGNWAYYDGTDQRSATAADSSAHVHSVAFINSASGQMWLDGASIKTGDPGANTSRGVALGAQGDTSNAFDGLIAEVLIYASALSTADRQQTELYLKTKWGTP